VAAAFFAVTFLVVPAALAGAVFFGAAFLVGTDFFPAAADVWEADVVGVDAGFLAGAAAFRAVVALLAGASTAFFTAVTSTSFKVHPSARKRPLDSDRVRPSRLSTSG